MNLRSLLRRMPDPEPPQAGHPEIISQDTTEEVTIEEAIRGTFEKVLRAALDEMERQRTEEAISMPITIGGELHGQSGQSFRLILQCAPPGLAIEPDTQM